MHRQTWARTRGAAQWKIGRNLEVDGLDAADGALDLGQAFVGPHAGVVIEGFGGKAGADHIDAVKARLGGDVVVLAREGEVGVRDGEREVLGHLVFADDGADLEADLGLAAERLPGATHGVADGGEVALGCGEQVLALAPPGSGEIGIAADDEALARIVVGRDAGEIALVEQRELEGAGIEQGADLRGA